MGSQRHGGEGGLKPIPLTYCPDLDTDWRTNPGALTSVINLAPSQSDAFLTSGEVLGSSSLTANGCNLNAYIFQKVDGTYRLLTFGTDNIDEYDASWTRTNRATGFGTLASTAHWQAAAQGNAIIAVNYATASQVSTGAGFAALGGGSPKAQCVCANATFVMMANYDDGVNQYKDGWWCSAIGNYASWTVSASTQATSGRLLDAPGPITALIAYKSSIIAFKENSMFIGEYVGPSVVWAWSMLSNRVGCVGPNAVIEAGGRLFFAHSSGFYMFDGSSMPVNIGYPVWKSFLSVFGYANTYTTTDRITVGQVLTPVTLGDVNTSADDYENIVWFSHRGILSSKNRVLDYGYNYITNKWGRLRRFANGGSTGRNFYARCSTANLNGFFGTTDSRGLFIDSQNTASYHLYYPYVSTNYSGGALTGMDFSEFTTGPIGDESGSTTINRVTVVQDSGGDAFIATSGASTVTTYNTSAMTSSVSTSAGTLNTTSDCFDHHANGKFHQISVDWYSAGEGATPNAVKGKIRGLAVDIEKHARP